MNATNKKRNDINVYIEDREYIANKYVMRCFAVTMLMYFIAFILNVLNIFIIDRHIMLSGFIPSIIIYGITYAVTWFISLSSSKTKYYIMFSVVCVFTHIGVTITYHVVLIALLPILYATLYSSKRVMWYVYGLTVISTIVIVYGGYYYGLCDANMALLTTTRLEEYILDGQFALITVNTNPMVSLMLFFVVPRCMIYVAVVAICNSIVRILRGSVRKAKHVTQMKEFQKELKKKVNEQTVELRIKQEKIEESYLQTVLALSGAVEAKDRYTSGHSKRVATYAKMIAARMGKSEAEQDEIYFAGLLHDVGKIRIPVDIINKPGRLTDEEYNMIKLHPVTGYHILRGISEHNDMAVATKYHHERYDGKGYPNGLVGESIPEDARILGVADAYDAMTSNRSYRDALPQEVVRAEIEKGRGTQFDPRIADIMLQLIDEDKDYHMRQIDKNNCKILLICDDEECKQLIKDSVMEEKIYEFTSVGTSRRAMDMIDEENFELILVDAEIDNNSGLKFLEDIREKCQTPIVLMSVDKTLRTSTEFVKLGCDDCITKPFSSIMIKEVIYNMTSK